MKSSPPPGWAFNSVAVFRALRLGDMLCAVPALRALRAGLPEARITLVGLPWAAAFARRFARYVDDFIAFPGDARLPEEPVRRERLAPFYRSMRLRRFALAIQLHGNGGITNGIVAAFGAATMAGFRPGPGRLPGRFLRYPERGQESLRLARLAEYLGMPEADPRLEFPLERGDYEELHASGLAARLSGRPYVCVHPGASNADKRWHPEAFAAVGDRLAEEFGVSIVLTGSAAERDVVARVAAAMRRPAIKAASAISVGALAALMNDARLLVCNDTGVSHIAAGLRLPSVVVFSNSDIERWAPLDHRLHACVWKPDTRDAWLVLAHARRLLRDHPSRSRAS
ncbi:MAG TPA: glycosyltransferase family 9 protein [Rhodocyclaceae bacterium]